MEVVNSNLVSSGAINTRVQLKKQTSDKKLVLNDISYSYKHGKKE